MLARIYRFHGHNALHFVYQKGKTARTPLCLLKYVPNPRRKQARVAVVVGKKIHKSAVVRNRIRRRFYEAIREAGVGEWLAYDLVFTVLDERTEALEEKDIKNIISQLLQISGVNSGPVEK
jgi:ribonuclease P protein component